MVEDQDISHQDIEMHPHLQEVDLQAEVVVIIVHQVDQHQVDRHQVHTEIQLQHHHQIDRIVLDNKQQLNKQQLNNVPMNNVLKPIDKKLIEQINLQKLEN